MRAGTSRSFSSNAGFTFVEILASMLFLAILIPTVMSALALSNRAGILSERTTTAMQLAENRLSEALVDGTWITGNGGGDFGNDWPGYRWELKSTDWPEDTMSELTVTVFFQVQGREQDVELTTLASETPVQP
jgi:type II secretory pathway pseudopilin PulG